MKIFKKIILLSFIYILTSCGTLKEGFSNQKKNNKDEFLVEKKSPLVMPPDFNELPLPKTSENIEEENESVNNIKKLISNNNSPESSGVQDKNFENLIIEKIKQN